MMKLLQYISLILLLINISCSIDTDNDPIIRIDLTKSNQSTLDDFIAKAEIIPLETNENVLIRSITKVVHYKNKYFVKDISEGVFVFNENGRFLYKVGSKGRGPGEYGYISDFNINKYNSNIELLTPIGKIIIYNEEGQYLYSINCPSIEVSNFLIVNKDLILFFHQSQSPILTLFSRKENKVIKEFFQVTESFVRRRPLYLISPPFYISNSDTFIHYDYSNDVYSLKGLNIKYMYSFDFGKNTFLINNYKWTLDYDKDYYKELIWKNGDVAFGFHNHYESKRYIIKQFYYNSGSKLLIYDKHANRVNIIPVFDDLYDMSFNKLLWEKVSPAEISGTRLGIILNWDSGNNYLLVSVKSTDKKVYMNPSILDSLNMELYKAFGPEDNPIIVKYFLKE